MTDKEEERTPNEIAGQLASDMIMLTVGKKNSEVVHAISLILSATLHRLGKDSENPANTYENLLSKFVADVAGQIRYVEAQRKES